MPSTSRRLRRFACLIPAVLLALPLQLHAEAPAKQTASAAKANDGVPWLYRGSDVPVDREWQFGELPNGLRYAVRKNGVPPGQVSIRIRVDAGSLYEAENERGFAHLLEHLVFRQSRHLGDGEAIPAFQRLGATFGSDTNAETSPVSTTYKLDLPDVTPVKLDETFKLLSGMMIAPTLSEANVRTDVPIVLAEKRERGGAAERVTDAMQQTLFAGQKLAVRPVIGTVETLETANQARVRAFHARWYRPENTTVIAVGDVDPAQLAMLTTRYFGEWKGNGRLAPAPEFGDPLPPRGSDPANPVGEARVMVEPDLARAVTYAVMRPWRPVNDTVAYNQGNMIDALAQMIINRRLEARARTGGSFLAAQVSQEKHNRSVDATFVSIAPLGEDWRAAVKDVRAAIADAMASAPTQDEIDREVAEMNVAYESSVEQRRLLPGSKLADDMVTAIDIREAIASPETVQDIFNQSRPLFTPQAVLDHTRRLFAGSVTRAIYVTPTAGEADAPALRTALAAPVGADGKSRIDTKPISFADLPPLGAPGRIAGIVPTGLGEIEQIEFANGVKALIWPVADEPGRVAVRVRFGAGYRAFAAGDAAYVALGELALVSSGQGKLGQEELDRISTGRKMGYEFSIGESAFQFSAETRPADVADQLYLFADKLGNPRWDVPPLVRAKAAAKLNYEAYATSPQGVLERDLAWLEHGEDGRFRTPTPRELEAASPQGFREVWQPILERGPVEVQVFGDIDRTATIEALRRTFGALPSRGGLSDETGPARMTDPKASPEPVVLTHRGDKNQAAALISWPTGGGMSGVRESRQLEILAQLFQNRLLDRFREKLGESYSPQVYNSWPLDLENGGKVMALAQIQPRAVPVFFATADEIAADLIARPPSADELARVTEPLKQKLNRASTSSAYFMSMLEGASEDPRKYASIRDLLPDYTVTTPAEMQALAKKYLARGKSWRLAVIPEGTALVTASSPAVPAR